MPLILPEQQAQGKCWATAHLYGYLDIRHRSTPLTLRAVTAKLPPARFGRGVYSTVCGDRGSTPGTTAMCRIVVERRLITLTFSLVL